jgi:hypothetical protein
MATNDRWYTAARDRNTGEVTIRRHPSKDSAHHEYSMLAQSSCDRRGMLAANADSNAQSRLAIVWKVPVDAVRVLPPLS